MGGQGVGAEFFAQDAKARVGGEAEFDLFAPNAGNDDLYRPSTDRALTAANLSIFTLPVMPAVRPPSLFAYRR